MSINTLTQLSLKDRASFPSLIENGRSDGCVTSDRVCSKASQDMHWYKLVPMSWGHSSPPTQFTLRQPCEGATLETDPPALDLPSEILTATNN